MKGLVQKFTVVSAAFGVACLAGIASPAHAQTKVVVDPGKKYQVFEGWGTSLCWWAVKAGAWSEANRSSLIGAIADPDTGLGYTIFRYNIGGGDQPGHDHLTKGDGGGKVPGENWAAPDSWLAEIDERRAYVKAAAERVGAIFVPFQSVLDEALARAPADHWLRDGVHPTTAGHALLAEAWLKAAAPALGL